MRPPASTVRCTAPLRRRELNIEYSYNGLEGCLGEVMLGRDALLVLDPGLRGQVERRLERLERVFGRRIEVIWCDAAGRRRR